jgi:ParB-like nuclease domain
MSKGRVGNPSQASRMNDHPISQHFPLLDRGELARLADDIRQNGLREAIVVYEGMILDGRNRWRACKIAGLEPKFKDYCGENSGAGRSVVELAPQASDAEPASRGRRRDVAARRR